MNKSRLLFLIAAGWFLAGCLAQTKVPLRADAVAQHKIGQMTRQQLIEIYGPPQKESVTGDMRGDCFVHYMGMSGKARLLYVQYDEQGILRAKNLDDATAEKECGDLQQESMHHTGGSGGGSGNGSQCMMDIQCGIGARCAEGVCTGGIGPQGPGSCVTGQFGRKVCSNNGRSCFINADCL